LPVVNAPEYCSRNLIFPFLEMSIAPLITTVKQKHKLKCKIAKKRAVPLTGSPCVICSDVYLSLSNTSVIQPDSGCVLEIEFELHKDFLGVAPGQLIEVQKVAEGLLIDGGALGDCATVLKHF